LDLGGDHRDELGGRYPFIVSNREAEQPVIELVAQAPEHALAELPLVDVDIILERPVDENEGKEDPTQRQQKGDLVELQEAIQILREFLAADCAVDDRLRQV